MLNKGLKKHGERGEDAVLKEITQFHDRACFEPIKVENMTPEEKQQVQMALTYPTEKRDRQLKNKQFTMENQHKVIIIIILMTTNRLQRTSNLKPATSINR